MEAWFEPPVQIKDPSCKVRNLLQQVDLDPKNKILLPHIWWKDRKSLILCLLLLPHELLFLAILKHSSLLFWVKGLRLWNTVIFETSEIISEPKVVDPLWTKALFFFLDRFATLHLSQQRCNLAILLISPQEMFGVNFRCHSTRESYIQW